MFPSHQNYSTEARKSQSECIKVCLSSDLRPSLVVSPPISTVMPLILFAMRFHLLREGMKKAAPKDCLVYILLLQRYFFLMNTAVQIYFFLPAFS